MNGRREHVGLLVTLLVISVGKRSVRLAKGQCLL